LKMKESAPDSPATAAGTAAPLGPVKDADGFSYFASRNYIAVGRANGLARWVGMNIAVESDNRSPRLTGLLNSLTGVPVIDATGLKGKYDFTLTFGSDSAGGVSGVAAAPSSSPDEAGIAPAADPGLTIFAALEKQLGLKLEPRKVMIDVLVIDHADKTPVEN